jgi:hypothetical protein
VSALFSGLTPYLLAGMAALGLLSYALYERSEAAATQLEAANAVIKQAEIDKADNAKAIGQLNQQLAANDRKITSAVEKVYAAPQTNACANSPAMRAASDSLRDLFPGSQTGNRSGAPAAMPGPGAGAGQPH